MRTALKEVKQKTCKACGEKFRPSFNSTQVVCSVKCAQAHAPVNQQKARKAIDQRERREIKVRKEKLKSRADHLKEAQVVVNQYVRLRDADLPCVSCGRFHDGQWHAGHFRSAGGHPELRFEPLNIWRQCAPCNTHKSGDLVNYRAELVRRIGAEKVEWLEGPHEARRYTIDDLKAIKAEYRAKIKQMKEQAA
ncbi:recombination protein NinG [Pseudomonas alloputida]|uniref:Recombination protein NinG n=1 Tax=Pseudomonas alloputida TaxID=1940621 RepID=A0AAW7HVV7_9PSED|nr:recombination protein NinG [Pseudomonas alloputida]MCE0860705.1 recombination protein NinG [Pseudomonas alloputida]MCE0866728.1 recombination protein NinG [Pseudomonas alloputida]MCE0889862.1 recombination protein NinG [Pseudomonas alloputida]MCE0919073.1 recombination protein NinG [Pseudomonas alloputida]MCE1045588.1 recombination protein NinG [Pseudomonas alloputida]